MILKKGFQTPYLYNSNAYAVWMITVKDLFKKYGKIAKIKGFRPGKVPKKILERYFGDQVLEDVTNSLIKETLPEALEETKTRMLYLMNGTLVMVIPQPKSLPSILITPQAHLPQKSLFQMEKSKFNALLPLLLFQNNNL